MKRFLKVLPATLLLIACTYLVSATSFPFPPDRTRRADSILLKTQWKQMGGFERYTPDKLRLGCWSTALAQIVYYHRLKPFGHIAYTSRNGYRIDERIDSAAIDFSLIADRLDNTTSGPVLDQTARYNYYAALAVQKDFGTDRYLNKLAPADLLEAHYAIRVSRYICWRGIVPNSTGKLEKVICRELDAKRPLFLHFADLKNFGHSVVIDGYYWKERRLMVHLNQGQGGPQDGWYDFSSDLLVKNDRALRVIYTIRPL